MKLKCKICGSEFEHINPRANVCSDKCRKENELINARNRKKKYRAKLKKNKVVLPKQCIFCNKYFIPTHQNQKFCSDECRHKQLLINQRKADTKYYYNHRPRMLKKARDFYKENKDYFLQWQKDNKIRCDKYKKNFEERNPGNNYKRNKKWIQNNRNQFYKMKNNWYKNKCKTDVIFHLKELVRNYIKQNMKFKIQNEPYRNHSSKLPYSIDELKSHIESQFIPGMSWSNWGTVWEIDHIIPRSRFTSYKAYINSCWHPTNLQPLPKLVNSKKSDIYQFDWSYYLRIEKPKSISDVDISLIESKYFKKLD